MGARSACAILDFTMDADPNETRHKNLLNPANQQFIILIGATHARNLCPFNDDPCHAILGTQAFKISFLKVRPAILCLNLLLPDWRQTRNLCGHGRILHRIGEHAAFCPGAEAVGVFTRSLHVVRAQGKQTVGRSVALHPEERLHPAIAGNSSRPLDMVGRREGLALRQKHAHA
jgi:hypothetical protein